MPYRLFYHIFLFSENETVVKEKIKEGGDDGSEDEGAGGLGEIIGEREIYGLKNVEGKIIKWSDKAKELSEKGADKKGGGKVPDKEFVDGSFGEGAFFPSDFRMEEVGKDGGGESAN